jgi:hypothetical protein
MHLAALAASCIAEIGGPLTEFADTHSHLDARNVREGFGLFRAQNRGANR